MSGSLSDVVYRLLVCVTGALIAVFLLRLPMRHVFGAHIAYRIWLLVPIAAIGSVTGSLVPIRVFVPIALPVQLSNARVPWPPSPANHMPLGETYWIVVCWVLGVGLFAFVQWQQHRGFVRRLGAMRRTPTGAWMAGAEDIGPMVLGAFPPRVVLPADFDRRYTMQEQALVLAHEAMHIIRRDPFANVTVTIVRSLLWFHPLVHLAAWYFRIDQELACDAAVLQNHSRDCYHYAHAMLKSQMSGSVLRAGCPLDSSDATFLKRRIVMLEKHSLHHGRRTLGAVVVAISLITSGGVTTFLTAQDRVSERTQPAQQRRDIGNAITTIRADSMLRADSVAPAVRRRDIGNAITTIQADSVLQADSVRPATQRRHDIGNAITTIRADSVLRADSVAPAVRRRDIGNAVTTIQADSVIRADSVPPTIP